MEPQIKEDIANNLEHTEKVRISKNENQINVAKENKIGNKNINVQEKNESYPTENTIESEQARSNSLLNKIKKYKWYIIVSLIAALVIIGIIVVVVLLLKKPKTEGEITNPKDDTIADSKDDQNDDSKDDQNDDSKDDQNDGSKDDQNDEQNNDQNDDSNADPKDEQDPNPGQPIKKEFDIRTKPGELKQISVTQKSREETTLNNYTIVNDIIRKTNYDIYFISEYEPDEDNKLFFSKMYTGVISIRSECTTEEEDCTPQPLLELTSVSSNLRFLEDSEIFKDQQIPICIFNITDNNVITTLICPESLSDIKRNEIILDLYFFRPPAAERADKVNDNITLIIVKDEDTNKTFIHETNGGYCNIYNNWCSECTTDMNTTLDSIGNLISYTEQAITKINYDEINSFFRDKITNLIDTSENVKINDILNYKNAFDNLIKLIKPYMKEELQFSESDFQDLFNVIKDKKKSPENQSYNPQKTKNTFRNLAVSKIQNIKNSDLFFNKITPIQIKLGLKINSGISSSKMGVYGSINLDDKEFDYTAIEEDSSLEELISKLSCISKSANFLAGDLYDKIYDKLESMVNVLSIRIRTLEDLLNYYSLYGVYNHTLITYSYKKLPSDIVRLSNELVNKLSTIFNNIKSGEIKQNAEKLSYDVYSYIEQIHQMIRKMLTNLENLSNIIITKNNTFTAITNYYLNNTSSSYINIIQMIKDILDTYFVNEFNKIYPKIELLIKLMEQNSDDSLRYELTSLKSLYNNLKNRIYTINSITEADLQTVISNLENASEYPSEIIKAIINYIKELMNIKSNGYFISDEEINNFNNSFISIISEAEKVAEKLNGINLIDKVFDQIMIKFRDSFIYTVKFMEEIKTGNFTLEEDVLNTTTFTTDVKNKMENDIKTLCDEIISKIKRENEIYIGKIKRYFDSFLEENLDNLNDIIFDLNVIFSEEAIKALANSFENALNISLERFTNIIKTNVNLTTQYMDKYYNIINDESALRILLQNYYLDYDEIYRPYYDRSRTHQFPIFDIIYSRMKTSAYLSKYNTFMANLNYSEEYLINQLHFDIITEYREIFTNIKEQLQSIINNKLSEKFPYFYEVNFFDKHIRIIDKLNSRLDKYFSTDIFDNKFLKIINESINMNINLIKSTKTNVQNKHNSMQNFAIYNDNSNDICITFRRKVCYGCTNCVSYTYFYDRFCFILTPYEYNYLYLTKASYESLKKFGNFNDKFTTFTNEINIKTSRYNNILNNLNLNISLIKQETLNENITLNYLELIKNWVELIMREKYGNTLLQNAYNYYKLNIEGKLENIFSDIFHKWKNSFNALEFDVRKNKSKIKYSLYEFTEMSENYRTIIQVDLTENYFNSIMLFEKSELDYTITYYYNYFLKLINKSYKYIIQNIPANLGEFNDILTERKEEIKNTFDLFGHDIIESSYVYTSEENQLNILHVNETDFFKVKHILKKNIQETDESLQADIDVIWEIEHFLQPSDKYALVMRYYLENQEYGKLIEQLYEPLDRGEFIYLDLIKFKDVMLDNWVFDSDDFVNILNNSLVETNREIKNELNSKLENYGIKIEDEINKFFDDTIENIINKLYEEQIKDLTSTQIDNINSYILEIINEIESMIQSLVNKIKDNPKLYKLNIEKIKNSLSALKNKILEKINNSLGSVLYTFYENVYRNIYSDCIESKLTDYLNQVRNIISSNDYGEYNLLNSSYNIGEIIYNLTDEVVHNYKNIITKKINMKYIEYFDKIKSAVNLPMINFNISNNFDILFETKLLPELKPANNCTSIVCTIFDFTTEILGYDINSKINEKINEIKNEMEFIKGDNYQANFQCNLDFSNSGNEVIKPICDSLKSFLSFEKEEQVSHINEFIQNVIKSNLDEFLNSVVPTFGDEFFERIIDYNINFQLTNLYETIYYSFCQTLIYYHGIHRISPVIDLPTDLKDRIYSLNNLDLTIIDKVRDIKSLSERKLNELIEDLKNVAKDTYNNFLKDNEVIQKSFSSNILEKIDFNLVEIMPDIERNYQNTLEKYLKEKFMNEFFEVLDERSDDMIRIFYEEKNRLKEKLDDLFSSEEDKDLKEVNENINKTIESIERYKGFLFQEFHFSENARNFFLNYGRNKLLPIFQQFKVNLNEETKRIIIEEINIKSQEIENVSPEPFKQKLNETYYIIFDDYIYYIQKAIEEYGDIEDIYNDNLIGVMDTCDNNFGRRISDTDNEDEIFLEERNRINSRYVEDSLELIVNKTRNTKNFIDNLYAFYSFDNRIKTYKTQLRIDYKNVNNMIVQNKYIYDIELFLRQKLLNLTDILTNYYDQISTSFSYFKQDLIYTVYHIYNSLDNCMEITKNVLNREYQKISNSTTPINKIRTNYIDYYPNRIRYNHKAENLMNNVTVYLEELTEYAEFKLDLILEGDRFLIPKVKARIVDQTVPKNAEIMVVSGNGACFEKGHYFTINPKNANYTMTVEYDTKSSYINITTITLFDKYNYKVIFSETKGELSSEPITVNHYIRAIKCENVDKKVDQEITLEVPAKDIVETKIINR